MKVSGVVLALMVLLSFGGCVINMNLTRKHTSKAVGPEWFATGCTPESKPAYDCDAVIQTKWAVFSLKTFSFVEPDESTGAQPGVPVALMGWFYFIGLAVWFTAIGRPSHERRFWHLVPTVTVIAGCASSAFFAYLLLARMDVKCFWCMVSHGINFLLLVGTLAVWPRRPAALPAACEVETEQEPPDIQVPPTSPCHPHPGWRLVFVTGLCTLCFMYAAYSRALGDRHRYEAEVYRAQLEEIAEDTTTLLAQFQAQEPVKIKLRKDDPRRGEGEALLQMVVFSDFRCPACRQLAGDIEEKINPAFDNLLRVVWKHYPMCQECNPYLRRTLHPKSCEAAYAAEAARLQGGNDAFWKAHDFLFAQTKLFKSKEIDWGKVAEELELDPERFCADMRSAAVKQRVVEDVEQGYAFKLRATPSIFLSGRPIRRYMFGNAPFVEQVKQSFLKNRQAALRRAGPQRPKAPKRRPATQPASPAGNRRPPGAP